MNNSSSQGHQQSIDLTLSDTAPPSAPNRSHFSQIVDGILNSDFNEIINHSNNMYQNNRVSTHAGPNEPQPSSGNINHQLIMNSALSNSDQVVLNLLANNGNTGNHLGNENTSAEPSDASHHHNHGHSHNQQQQQQQQEMNGQNNFFLLAFKTLQSSLPFLIILIAKIFHQHLLGFFVVFGFMITLQWSNKTMVKQVELKVTICDCYNCKQNLLS